jgi:hypothetical protein
MEKKPMSSVVVGLMISLVLIVFGLVVYFANLYTEKWAQYAGTLIFVIAIIWAVFNHGKENSNTLTFGNLFAFGFKTVAVVACIMILYTFLSGYIFPDIKEKVMENARLEAAKNPNPNATPEQIEQGMAMFEKNYTLFIVLGLTFWYLISGVIASLIGAAITKKNPQSFDKAFK